MHVHLPKPLHGWRAFLGEVEIIVVGVLIALGAEQVVEHFHERAQLREMEDAMRSELRDDNLPQAYTRAAIYNCYADQLDALENAVAAGDRAQVRALAQAYMPITRSWDDQAWKAALSSQALVHSGAQRMLRWSTAYEVVPPLAAISQQEMETMPQLRARLSGTGAISTEQQDRLFQTIALLRRANNGMSGQSLILIIALRERGMTLSAREKAALQADARRAYGACVVEPAPERLRFNTQITGVASEAQLGRK